MSWRVERAGPLCRWMFAVYLAAVLGAFAIPSAVENVLRLRYAAIPLAVLTLSLRRWRPLPVALGVLALAISWNVSPIAGSYLKGRGDPAAAGIWAPGDRLPGYAPVASYRVEVVDTTGHWALLLQGPVRSPAAATGRTTSRRTSCSTTNWGVVVTWLRRLRGPLRGADDGAGQSYSATARRRCCGAAIPG